MLDHWATCPSLWIFFYYVVWTDQKTFGPPASTFGVAWMTGHVSILLCHFLIVTWEPDMKLLEVTLISLTKEIRVYNAINAMKLTWGRIWKLVKSFMDVHTQMLSDVLTLVFLRCWDSIEHSLLPWTLQTLRKYSEMRRCRAEASFLFMKAPLAPLARATSSCCGWKGLRACMVASLTLPEACSAGCVQDMLQHLTLSTRKSRLVVKIFKSQ